MLESFAQNSQQASELSSQRLSTEAFDQSLQSVQLRQGQSMSGKDCSTECNYSSGEQSRRPNESFALTPADLEKMYWHEASAHMRSGDFVGAERAFQKLLKLEEVVHGKNSKEVAVASICLGISIERQGRTDDAEPHFARAVQILRNLEGPDGRTLGIALREQGINFIHGEKYSDAEKCLTESLRIAKKLDPNGRYTAWVMSDLAVAQTHLGKHAEAETGFKTAVKMIESAPGCGPNDQSLIPILKEYAQLLAKMGRLDEASAALQRAREISTIQS